MLKGKGFLLALKLEYPFFSQESKLKKQFPAPERDTISDSGRSIHSVQPVIDKSIALHIYGVDDPGPEITVELVEVLQNRINEAMLEVLSVLLSRNPNCKLTYADVRVSVKGRVSRFGPCASCNISSFNSIVYETLKSQLILILILYIMNGFLRLEGSLVR